MTEYDILMRSGAALLAGALIGLERTYRGRAAGLRTNALVALGSALLVATAEYATSWGTRGEGDPTRVIQGIVTGIGFLGAGVIIKEGFSVRGLTTAAGVWVVAALGVVFGTGLYLSGCAATIASWLALEVMHRFEYRIRAHSMVHCQVVTARKCSLDEARLRQIVQEHWFSITELAYHLDGATQMIEYELAMWSTRVESSRNLERSLLAEPEVVAFRIAPGRD